MKSHLSSHKYAKLFNGLPEGFLQKALELFQFQYRENALYHSFAELIQVNPSRVSALHQIPFLPVSFFKTASVTSGQFEPEIIFESSGTSGHSTARHCVRDLGLYRESFVKGFEFFYGVPQDYCILGLLPAYLERKGSSLVYMVEELIRLSGHAQSGFYLYDFEKLHRVLDELEERGQQTLLIGVSFALLDFAELYPMKLSHTLVMETGGMKGRKKELTRMELHEILEKKLGLTRVHSEYGMTELLSQAYSSGKGLYQPVPWMKMLVRDEDDPQQLHSFGEGLLNIIDLANRDSCAFIATDDVVRLNEDGSFEVLGRMDNSDIRGCSLLVV
jgi:hypothetical protein